MGYPRTRIWLGSIEVRAVGQAFGPRESDLGAIKPIAEVAQTRVTLEHAAVHAGEEVGRLREVVAALEADLADARGRADRAESAATDQQARAERAEQAVLTRADELATEFRSATSWRIGQAVTAPARAARRFVRRLR